MLAVRCIIVAQQVAATARSAREFSQSTAHHAMASAAHGALDVTLVALGVVVVIVTTIYSRAVSHSPGGNG